MVHNRTCGCQNCFEINYPDRQNPHSRSFGYGNKKLVPKMHDVAVESVEPYEWLRKESVTFHTQCWWCGKSVYFHRNQNGGCVLFDQLCVPWAIHHCWEQYREPKSIAVDGLIAKRISQLQETRINGIQFSKAKKKSIHGFIIGVDRSRKIFPDPSRISDKSSHLMYVIFRTTAGKYLKLLVPEPYIDDIIKFSYVSLTIELVHKSNEIILNCIKKLTEIRVDDLNRKELLITYNYQSIVAKPWTFQSKQ